MRALLIDNYDSFTFNVAQAIAAVNGEDPIVIKNDELSYDELIRLDFDNIVISPGPGTPDSDRDFGVCRQVVRYASCPVLGICMGFQGIALLAGSRVVPAPAPWHGRGSFVYHDGEELFAGIPSPFFAIRYHSLHVPTLEGTELFPTARTGDGILMGFRHPARPVWGVQFHPESVSTEYGRRIFENFRDLSLGYLTPPVRSAPAGRSRSRDSGGNRGEPTLPVRFRKLTGVPGPEAVFARLFGRQRPAVWLDSNAALSGRSRFSFMAAQPDEVLAYRSRHRKLQIATPAGVETIGESIFDYLQSALAAHRTDSSELPFEFCGGYLGYFGYELKGECGGEYRHESDLPDAYFLRVSRFVAFDHASGECYVVAVGHNGDEEDWIAATAAGVQEAVAIPVPNAGAGPPPRFELEQDRERYMAGVNFALKKIGEGESYQVCLTNRASGRFEGDPFDLYRLLRRRNPAPFSAFLNTDEFSVLCSSPERFLRVLPDGAVESRPIKGTAPRSHDPREDVRLREELLNSEKNRAENLMIADLLRNDLGQTAQTGSVQVPSLMAVESYETVHHLVSTVQSRLAADNDAIDCVRCAFPGGSMTGAPKVRTMEIIDDLESSARGVYSGALGYLSFTGAADLNIVIRTMVVQGGRVRLGMGGGVVAMSDPEDEFDEAMLKAKALMDAVDEFSEGAGELMKGDMGSA